MTSEGQPGGEPTRDEIDGLKGPVLLEFGATWCPHCQALDAQLTPLLGEYPAIKHIKVEDGKGKPLGRSFKVKLWPTLVFMRDGRVLKQVSRPPIEEVEEGLAALKDEG